MHAVIRTLLGAALCISLFGAPASGGITPVGSAFTFQGRLDDAGAPVDGDVDLRFRLYDAESGGAQLGLQLDALAVAAADGLFTVDLDFGAQFGASRRWLEIDVRLAGGGAYTTLAPRQPVMPAPVALFALDGNYGWSGLSGIPAGFADDVDDELSEGEVISFVENGALNLAGGTTIGGQDPFDPVNWGDLVDVPAGFADGVDDDTTYSAGAGLVLAGTMFSIDTDAVASANLASDADSLEKVSGGAMVSDGANIGIGVAAPVEALEVDGTVNATVLSTASGRGQMGEGAGVGNAFFFGANGFGNVAISNTGGLPNNGVVTVQDSAGVSQAFLYVDGSGFGIVAGDLKSFVADHPEDPEIEYWYASLEGPEAAIYARGTALLVAGEATIQLPQHFSHLAMVPGMTVHLTPLSAGSMGLAAVEKSLDRVVVRELMRGAGTYEFDWEVKAVRCGFEGFEVVRPKGSMNVEAGR